MYTMKIIPDNCLDAAECWSLLIPEDSCVVPQAFDLAKLNVILSEEEKNQLSLSGHSLKYRSFLEVSACYL